MVAAKGGDNASVLLLAMMNDTKRLVVHTRRLLERALRAGGVELTKKSASGRFFGDDVWRTFWYDPDTGESAVSAWDSERDFAFGFPRTVPERQISTVRAACGLYACYQLPQAIMLPLAHTVASFGTPTEVIPMDIFHMRHPDALLLIDIPYVSDRWCSIRSASKRNHCPS
jgi:hypothetical protein